MLTQADCIVHRRREPSRVASTVAAVLRVGLTSEVPAIDPRFTRRDTLHHVYITFGDR